MVRSSESVRRYWAKYAKCERCGAQEKMCCRRMHEISGHKRMAVKACHGRGLL